MGALGRIYPNGDLDLGLTIRTFAVAEGRIHLWVGGGIVWDSDPAAEVEESLVKARPLLSLLARVVSQSSSATICSSSARAAAPGGDCHQRAWPSTNVCQAQSAFSRSGSTPQ